jgi:hypothetical protein
MTTRSGRSSGRNTPGSEGVPVTVQEAPLELKFKLGERVPALEGYSVALNQREFAKEAGGEAPEYAPEFIRIIARSNKKFGPFQKATTVTVNQRNEKNFDADEALQGFYLPINEPDRMRWPRDADGYNAWDLDGIIGNAFHRLNWYMIHYHWERFLKEEAGERLLDVEETNDQLLKRIENLEQLSTAPGSPLSKKAGLVDATISRNNALKDQIKRLTQDLEDLTAQKENAEQELFREKEKAKDVYQRFRERSEVASMADNWRKAEARQKELESLVQEKDQLLQSDFERWREAQKEIDRLRARL